MPGTRGIPERVAVEALCGARRAGGRFCGYKVEYERELCPPQGCVLLDFRPRAETFLWCSQKAVESQAVLHSREQLEEKGPSSVVCPENIFYLSGQRFIGS